MKGKKDIKRWSTKDLCPWNMSKWKNRLFLWKKKWQKGCQKSDTCSKSGSSHVIKRKHRQQCCQRLYKVPFEERTSEKQMS